MKLSKITKNIKENSLNIYLLCNHDSQMTFISELMIQLILVYYFTSNFECRSTIQTKR